MRFEIPLTETQRYVLRITTGFSGLPLHFSQRDLEENKDSYRELSDSELPAWKRELQAKRKELDQQQEQIKNEINTFYAQRMNLYNECAEGKNRGDAAIAFRNALSAEDHREHEKLFEENYRIYEECEKISHKKVSICRRHSSKLLGIPGVATYVDEVPDCPWFFEFYTRRVIPRENCDAAQRAAASGVFSKEITSQDKDILRYVYERSGIHPELNLQKRRCPPTFSVATVALAFNCTDIVSVEESIYRLSGLLCHLYLPRNFEESERQRTITEYCDHWFIPRIRRQLVREVLGR